MIEGLVKLIDALSLSGAIVAMLFGLTLIGVIQGNEKVYSMFGAAFTSFVTGRALGQSSSKPKTDPKIEPVDEPKVEPVDEPKVEPVDDKI